MGKFKKGRKKGSSTQSGTAQTQASTTTAAKRLFGVGREATQQSFVKLTSKKSILCTCPGFSLDPRTECTYREILVKTCHLPRIWFKFTVSYLNLHRNRARMPFKQLRTFAPNTS